jgi:hypothetical protein
MSGCSAAATRAALLAALPLAFASACATLGGTVDREAKSMTWRCDGRVTVRVQTGAVRVECPSGPAPLVVIEGAVTP